MVASAPPEGEGGKAKGVVHAYLGCDLATRTCARGPAVEGRIYRAVTNPSRPMAEVTLADG